MQITVEISEEFAARAANLGLTPEAYARELLSGEQPLKNPGHDPQLRTGSDANFESAWEAEALRRADEIDAGQTQLIPWEWIESKLRSRIAG